LGLAVKPNRLLLPAFAPAAIIGFRLLPRDGRDSALDSLRETLPLREAAAGLLAGLAPFVWPLRGLHAAAAGLLALPFEAPFDACLPLPFPFAWAPLPFVDPA
jgi:hypothetical protein